MAQAGEKRTEGATQNYKAVQLARDAQAIKTTADFARFMTSVMAAVIAGDIDSRAASSICASANVMLKAIEMQVKYGTRDGRLMLTEESTQPAWIAKKSESEIPPRQTGVKWCVDCGSRGKKFIQATETFEDDDLCLSCFNLRKK